MGIRLANVLNKWITYYLYYGYGWLLMDDCFVHYELSLTNIIQHMCNVTNTYSDDHSQSKYKDHDITLFMLWLVTAFSLGITVEGSLQ